MTAWQSWLQHPQRLWLRRAIFQVHLWTGIALGLYVVVVCVSGSAIVFRTDLEEIFSEKAEVHVSGKALTKDQLKQAAQKLYPGYQVRAVYSGRFPSEASEIRLVRGWLPEKRRLFNPYTGQDIGPAMSVYFSWLNWWGQLHGNLLMGPTGLMVNGIGGFLTAAVCMSGIVVWWPGITNWRRSLGIRRKVGWKRFNWDLHSAVGVWTFGVILMWGLTGAYFPFPEPFRAVIGVFTTIDPPRPPQQVFRTQTPTTAGPIGVPRPFRRIRRPQTTGQKILRGFSAAHYGTFGGWPVKALWVILGLLPGVLFLTGVLMWWNRVLAPAARRWVRRSQEDPVQAIAER